MEWVRQGFAPKYLTTQKAEVSDDTKRAAACEMCVPVCEYMCACICVPNSFPIKYRDTVLDSVSLSHQEASISLLSFSIRGQIDWKPQSQETNQSDHMDHNLV